MPQEEEESKTEPLALVDEGNEEAARDEDNPLDDEGEEIFIPSNFSIAIHKLLHTAHQSHGLLHNDYAAYRSYLSRRLSRLRHAPPVAKSLTHGSKSMHKQKKNAKRHSYHARQEPVTPAEVNSHRNHVLVFLYSSERAWAQAMELKAQYEELRVEQMTSETASASMPSLIGKKKPSPASVRQHYLKRLKKAVGFVEDLVTMGGMVCDEQTQLEIACYAGWMKGNWFTEKKDWKNACESYAVALQQCHFLSSTKDGSTAESLQLSDFFHSRATNTLQPLFRYTLYELEKEGGTTATSETSLSPLISEMMQASKSLVDSTASESNSDTVGVGSTSTSSETVSFRGCDAPLEDGMVRLAFLKIDTCKQEWTTGPSKNNDTKFLELLSAYDDCIDLVRKSVTEYEGMASGPAVNRKRRECVSLLGYCQFEKLKLLMDRNEQMVNVLRNSDFEIVGSKEDTTGTNNKKGYVQDDADAKYKRVEEITHLYDALLQNARTVVSLPGGMIEGDEEEIEDEFVLEAKATVLRIRSLRCYYLGRMYAADVVAKYTEAVALYDQAMSLAMEAAEEIAACQDMDRADELIDSMAALETEIIGAKCRSEACAYLAKCGSSASSATTGATLLRRLDDFDSGGRSFRLANVPPALEPIACKPSFFDIAHNYVTDFLDDDLEFHVNAHKLQSKGFLNWFRK